MKYASESRNRAGRVITPANPRENFLSKRVPVEHCLDPIAIRTKELKQSNQIPVVSGVSNADEISPLGNVAHLCLLNTARHLISTS